MNKKFQRRAFNLRTFFKVKTQVVLNGHLLQLKYRDSEEKGFVIDSEFYPSAEAIAAKLAENSAPAGLGPSTKATLRNIDTAKFALAILNVKGFTNDQICVILKDLLSGEDFKSIIKIELGTTAFLHFETVEKCNEVFRRLNGKESNGTKLNCTIFE